MILFPAIDLKDGRCVRLVRGEMASATVFNDDPAAQARAFAAAGCSWLHLVDLDGAAVGGTRNGAAIAAVRAAVGLEIQLGGGIRELTAIQAWLDRGVDRVVLGTAAVRNPDLVCDAAARHPGRIAVAIDAREGRVAVAGWSETTETGAVELARRFADSGVAAIVYTDIARDGTMSGVDAPATAALARAAQIPVIASGGVGSLADLAALKAYEKDGVCGVICGRALYDGRIEPRTALHLLSGGATC